EERDRSRGMTGGQKHASANSICIQVDFLVDDDIGYNRIERPIGNKLDEPASQIDWFQWVVHALGYQMEVRSMNGHRCGRKFFEFARAAAMVVMAVCLENQFQFPKVDVFFLQSGDDARFVMGTAGVN